MDRNPPTQTCDTPENEMDTVICPTHESHLAGKAKGAPAKHRDHVGSFKPTRTTSVAWSLTIFSGLTRQAFLPWALLTFGANNSFLYGDDMHCSSIPGLYPLDASGTHTKL